MISRLRVISALLLLGTVVSAPLCAHQGEPISTEFAAPFEPGEGNLQLNFEYLRSGRGAGEYALPEYDFELGLVPRFEVNMGYPLVGSEPGSGERFTVGGGKLDIGGRLLLLGGETESTSVSFQGTVTAAMGDSRLVGDAPELSGGIFIDHAISDRVFTHSNFSWGATVGEKQKPERTFTYHNAIVWFASFHWLPVFELLGDTETSSGRTDLAAQPEIIYHVNPHLELKFGVPVGITATTPRIGARGQVTIIWGGPR